MSESAETLDQVTAREATCITCSKTWDWLPDHCGDFLIGFIYPHKIFYFATYLQKKSSAHHSHLALHTHGTIYGQEISRNLVLQHHDRRRDSCVSRKDLHLPSVDETSLGA